MKAFGRKMDWNEGAIQQSAWCYGKMCYEEEYDTLCGVNQLLRYIR